MNAADALLAAMLRGETHWPGPAVTEAMVLERAHLHGVGALLHVAIEGSAGASSFPVRLREALRKRALAAAAIELARRRQLQQLLGLMAGAGIRPILMKGTALAYSLYAQPSLRDRADTDLWVQRAEVTRLFALLQAEGFRRPNATSGDLVSSEATFFREGSPLVLDVHWRVNNSVLLSRALDFAEADATAVPLPALGPHARGLGAANALVLAAMHRAAHFVTPFYAGEVAHRGDRLVWLHDLHLLAGAMTPEQWSDAARRAARHRISGLCLDALRCARSAFGTALPAGVLQTLTESAAAREPTMVFLEGGGARVLWAELMSLGSWRLRWRLLLEHGFPPVPYMLEKYRTTRRWLLPALYLRRALGWRAR